ncbi:hypothetical protein SELMODRAFT_421114 [Selaginella moellendorffii]|uniref:Cytochrome b5 domain-containing protein 1 n=1 Tax=Selaginella moellendorffii TaxID=88036 RepID=D8SEJ3_SELML|nr:cytochrome b5 domain-containing protein 1 [Selaginella moellendorffii]EFJ17213.1 hypothetical protein SELMODRAFT_421114 [Selaginella moellendorffii]|eukprot:XP_002981731.1 cytochrome b5 domain-containing protein 1 [Selaginella moellendorffii]
MAMIPTTPKRKSGWYTATEVKQHCTPGDCWITLLGSVYDVTNLVTRNPAFLGKLLIHAGGGDISHWFDPSTGSVKRHIDPVSKQELFHTPEGRFVHVPPRAPRTDWDSSFEFEWWNDPKYMIGKLSKRTRCIRVKNVLINQDILLEVPCEETVGQILDRYKDYNSHADSYSCRAVSLSDAHEFIQLDLNKTLQCNGVPDISDIDEFPPPIKEKLIYEYLGSGLPAYFYVPVILIYYNDDLTIA